MDLLPWIDDNQVVFYSRSKDCSEIVDIWVNRNGELWAKIVCPKDNSTTISLGKIDVPMEIRKIGKKSFRSESTKWIADQMGNSYPILKFGPGGTYLLCFKLNGRIFERRGKFRG